MLEHSHVSPVVDAPQKPLEAAKTNGKIADFSIHNNELILAGDIFIIATPPPPAHPHPQSCLGAWLSGIVLEMISNCSGFEAHARHCIESLSKIDYLIFVLVLVKASNTENRTYMTETLMTGT